MIPEKKSVSPHFPAKLLLFGEYSILEGGDALALPLFKFTGQLDFQKVSSAEENLHLTLKQKIVQYLSENQEDFVHGVYKSFLSDLNRGLRFHTNVPAGYGLGSSGMLSAALFDRYADKIHRDVSGLRSKLSSIERIYHGSSSGLDPLVSYLSKGIHIHQGEIQLIEQKVGSAGAEANNFFRAFLLDSSFFLLDTGQPRSTAKMVAIFRQLLETPAYRNNLYSTFIPLQNQAITLTLHRKPEALFKAFKSISQWQYENMQPMIPEQLLPHWKTLLDSDEWSLKLLGAGGGGFLLGMRKNGQSTPDYPFFTDLLGGVQKNDIKKTKQTALQQQQKFPLTWL